MKQHGPSIGNDTPKDREDLDHDLVPDTSEKEFKEAGEIQPQPADAAPVVRRPNAEKGREI